MYRLQRAVLNIAIKKDFAEKSDELKKILGEKIYSDVFIQKLDLRTSTEFRVNVIGRKLRGED